MLSKKIFFYHLYVVSSLCSSKHFYLTIFLSLCLLFLSLHVQYVRSLRTWTNQKEYFYHQLLVLAWPKQPGLSVQENPVCPVSSLSYYKYRKSNHYHLSLCPHFFMLSFMLPLHLFFVILLNQLTPSPIYQHVHFSINFLQILRPIMSFRSLLFHSRILLLLYFLLLLFLLLLLSLLLLLLFLLQLLHFFLLLLFLFLISSPSFHFHFFSIFQSMGMRTIRGD